MTSTDSITRFSAKSLRYFVFLAAILLIATGCPVIETRPVPYSAEPSVCESDIGAYRLPKTNYRVTVDATLNAEGTIDGDYIYEAEAIVRGSEHQICMDYLASSAGKDTVKVIRTNGSDSPPTAQGLLQFVMSNAIDYSAIIVKKVVRTIFIAKSGNAGFTSLPTTAKVLVVGKGEQKQVRLADIEFDPLQPNELADANQRLRDFGLCVSLGSFSYNTDEVPSEVYCDAPIATHKDHPTQEPTITQQQVSFAPKYPGVAYRPKLSYDLYIYAKNDPTGPEPWALKEVRQVALENRAPVFSVGVSRAMFATRRTALAFDEGSLTGFCVSKTSGGLGFVEIPVEIIRSIVTLPTQILEVRINESADKQALAKIEADTIELQNRLIRHQQGDEKALGELGSLPGGKFKTPAASAKATTFTRPGKINFGAPTEPAVSTILNELCNEPSADKQPAAGDGGS